MKPVVAYVRVSTSAQLDGNGPEQQRQSICAYAAAAGLRVDEWVVDDESGTTEEREGIQELLTRPTPFTLIFDRIDRLGRLQRVCESLFDKFRAAGVEMVCVQHKLDDSTPIGRLIRQFMGALAEYQRSEMLGRLAQCRKAAVRKRGTFQGGRAPYGYRSTSDGQLAIDPQGAEMVRICFALRAEGLGMARIAQQLTDKGFRTSTGRAINPGQVCKILHRRDAYAAQAPMGSYTQLEPGVAAAHPAILRKDTYM